MRMRNPFSGDPGDEERTGNGAGDDPLAPPQNEPEGDEPQVSRLQADEPTEPAAEAGGDDTADDGDSGKEEQEITAPSIGPNTVIEKKSPEERLDFDKISDVDAMGRDKRREVVGKTYGPTKLRVFATFAAFFAVVGALTLGFYFLAKDLDAPPAQSPDASPWSQPDAPQQPPKELQ